MKQIASCNRIPACSRIVSLGVCFKLNPTVTAIVLEKHAEHYGLPWIAHVYLARDEASSSSNEASTGRSFEEGDCNYTVWQHYKTKVQSLLRTLGHIRSFLMARGGVSNQSCQQSLKCVPRPLFKWVPLSLRMEACITPAVSSIALLLLCFASLPERECVFARV